MPLALLASSPIYSTTSCCILMMSKLGLCGKCPSRVTAACCVSSNITAAFPHRHTCFHFSVCGDGRQGEVPIPSPLLHALARTRAWRASWLTHCGRPFWCINNEKNQKRLNWFVDEARGYIPFVLLPQWVVSKMRLSVDFNPLNHLLNLYQGGIHPPSLPLCPPLPSPPISFILSDGTLWYSLSDFQPCDNISRPLWSVLFE